MSFSGDLCLIYKVPCIFHGFPGYLQFSRFSRAMGILDGHCLPNGSKFIPCLATLHQFLPFPHTCTLFFPPLPVVSLHRPFISHMRSTLYISWESWGQYLKARQCSTSLCAMFLSSSVCLLQRQMNGLIWIPFYDTTPKLYTM